MDDDQRVICDELIKVIDRQLHHVGFTVEKGKKTEDGLDELEHVPRTDLKNNGFWATPGLI